jgi:hypothetical protein
MEAARWSVLNPLTSTKLNHKQTRPFNNQKHNSNITTTQSEQPQHRSKTNLNQIYKPKLLYKQTTVKPTSFATSAHQEKRFGAEVDDRRPPHEGQRSPQWAEINPTNETHGSQKKRNQTKEARLLPGDDRIINPRVAEMRPMRGEGKTHNEKISNEYQNRKEKKKTKSIQ